jgi:hypothetical protein
MNTEGRKAMYFKHRAAIGIAIPVLLGSALAVGAAALPAQAQTYQDTSLSATQVVDATFGGSGLGTTSNTSTITLTGTGVTWSLHGTVTTGVTLSGSTISYSGAAVTSPPNIVADATDGAGNVEALEIPVVIGTNSITVDGRTAVVKVSLSALTDANSSGTVKFSAVSSKTGDTVTIGESSLPVGLVSGNPLTYAGGTAAPGTYDGVVATATDSDGATLNGTFDLTVVASTVTTYGDEVNHFGNGFDAYQQHQYPGAIIAGWTATQADPATHFILLNGTHQGAYQFEYAPHGSGTGLCVSDPGGGWSSDPLRDGLILANCNTGPWQQFVPQSNGTLQDVATGLYINPDGTGAQLRGGSSATPWGGSYYTWTAYASLPS